MIMVLTLIFSRARLRIVSFRYLGTTLACAMIFNTTVMIIITLGFDMIMVLSVVMVMIFGFAVVMVMIF